MAGKKSTKRGRPPKQTRDLHTRRVAFMADDAAHAWLTWRCAETGAPVSEILRRALAAYMAANPAPQPIGPDLPDEQGL